MTKKATTTGRKGPAETAQQARAKAESGTNATAATEDGSAAHTAARTTTVGALAEAYLQSLEAAGKSRGTVFGYSLDLALAVKHFGEATKIGSLTERKVTAFFESDLVTKTKTGKPKAKPTIDKTRRVLRLAMVWAAAQGLIEKAPVPEKYAARGKSAGSNS